MARVACRWGGNDCYRFTVLHCQKSNGVVGGYHLLVIKKSCQIMHSKVTTIIQVAGSLLKRFVPSPVDRTAARTSAWARGTSDVRISPAFLQPPLVVPLVQLGCQRRSVSWPSEMTCPVQKASCKLAAPSTLLARERCDCSHTPSVKGVQVVRRTHLKLEKLREHLSLQLVLVFCQRLRKRPP